MPPVHEKHSPDEHPDQRIAAEVYDRHLTGETTAQDQSVLDQWATTAHRQRLLNALQEFQLPPADRTERAIALLRGRLGFSGGAVLGRRSVSYERWVDRRGEKGRPGNQSLRRNVWYALVSMALVLGAFTAGRHGSLPWRQQSASTSMSAYVTAQGERATITLPDGNTVALNVASRLEVPADYLAGNHTVRLHGEALFTIRHQSGTPFTVLTGTATTRVLGTRFLVRYYPSDTATLVVVRDGRVAVRGDATHFMVLAAAQQATVTQRAVSAENAEPAAFSFAAGVLTLKGGRLSEVIPELDRWYDADIRLGDSTLATRRMAGEYAAGSLSDLTELLEGIFDLRVVRDGRSLTLYRR